MKTEISPDKEVESNLSYLEFIYLLLIMNYCVKPDKNMLFYSSLSLGRSLTLESGTRLVSGLNEQSYILDFIWMTQYLVVLLARIQYPLITEISPGKEVESNLSYLYFLKFMIKHELL